MRGFLFGFHVYIRESDAFVIFLIIYALNNQTVHGIHLQGPR